MSSSKFSLASAIVFAGLSITSAFAQIQTVEAIDRGWYKANGSAVPDNQNYVVGYSYGSLYNNFFVFDPSQFMGGTIVSAKLRLFNPSVATSQLGDGYSSPDASETVVLHAFDGNVTTLTNGTGGAAAYTDLGDGAIFGSATANASKNGQWIEFALNGAFLTYANAVSDIFAIGGTLSTYSGATFFDQRAFGFSNELTLAPQLVLEFTPASGSSPVPEPSTYALAGAALLLGASAWRRRAGKAAPKKNA